MRGVWRVLKCVAGRCVAEVEIFVIGDRRRDRNESEGESELTLWGHDSCVDITVSQQREGELEGAELMSS